MINNHHNIITHSAARGNNTAARVNNTSARGSNTAARGSNTTARGSNTTTRGSNSYAGGNKTSVTDSKSATSYYDVNFFSPRLCGKKTLTFCVKLFYLCVKKLILLAAKKS